MSATNSPTTQGPKTKWSTNSLPLLTLGNYSSFINKVTDETNSSTGISQKDLRLLAMQGGELEGADLSALNLNLPQQNANPLQQQPWVKLDATPKRITIIGDKGCGKSSLVYTYLQHEWYEDSLTTLKSVEREEAQEVPQTKTENNNNNNTLDAHDNQDNASDELLSEKHIELDIHDDEEHADNLNNKNNAANEQILAATKALLEDNEKLTSELEAKKQENTKILTKIEQFEKEQEDLKKSLISAETEREELRAMWKQERTEKLEMEKEMVKMEKELAQYKLIHQQIGKLLLSTASVEALTKQQAKPSSTEPQPSAVSTPVKHSTGEIIVTPPVQDVPSEPKGEPLAPAKVEPEAQEVPEVPLEKPALPPKPVHKRAHTRQMSIHSTFRISHQLWSPSDARTESPETSGSEPVPPSTSPSNCETETKKHGKEDGDLQDLTFEFSSPRKELYRSNTGISTPPSTAPLSIRKSESQTNLNLGVQQFPTTKSSEMTEVSFLESEEETEETEDTEDEEKSLTNTPITPISDQAHKRASTMLELVTEDAKGPSPSDIASIPPPPAPPALDLDLFLRMISPSFHLMEGIRIFNKVKQREGVKYLVEQNILENSPVLIASFLAQTGNLNKAKLGEYLGTEANEEILRCFCNFLARKLYKGVTFEYAMRHFFSAVKLPSEGQQVVRIAEEFAKAYVKYNQAGGEVTDPEAATLLVCGLLMLNTQLHNPNARGNTMTKQIFMDSLSSTKLTKQYIFQLYDNIKANELAPIKDHLEPEEEDAEKELKATKGEVTTRKTAKSLMSKSVSSTSIAGSPTTVAPVKPEAPFLLVKKKVVIDKISHTFTIKDTELSLDEVEHDESSSAKLIDKEVQRGDLFLCVYSVEDAKTFEAVDKLVQRIIRLKTEEMKKLLKGKKSTSAILEDVCAKIILVGAKCDSKSRTVSFSQGAQLAIKLGVLFFEISAAKNKNIKELFITAYRQIIQSQKNQYLEQQQQQSKNTSRKKAVVTQSMTFSQVLELPKLFI